MTWNILRSRTVWGAVGLAISELSSGPITFGSVLRAVSTVVLAIGARDAVGKIEEQLKI